MKRLSTVVTLALWGILAVTVYAQTTPQARLFEQVEEQQTPPGTPGLVHVTERLINSPEGQQAIAKYRELKAQGLLPHARKSADAVGDTMTFQVRNLDAGSPNYNQAEDIEFVLLEVDDRFQIWVALDETNSEYISEVGSLKSNLGDQTPAGSYDINLGIIDIDEIIFGTPPDVDGDGKTDILWYDIRDGCTPPLCTSGFFDPLDLSVRNFRDIIYLDTNPSLTFGGMESVSQTAAHEYQHLIQLNYDNSEISFINEGLSEWAEVICGYTARPINYLGQVSTYNVPFLRFDRNDPINDYERAGLFINYIADRFGPLEVGKITRHSTSGTAGLRNGLAAMNASISLEELIFNFHVANFFNDDLIDPLYGYTTAQRQNIRAAATRFDGRIADETPTTRVLLPEGGVYYLVWEQVEDITLQFSPRSGSGDIRAEAFLFNADLSFDRVVPLDVSGNSATFDGTYSQIVVVLSHINPDGDFLTVDYSANWTVEQLYDLETTVYDDGSVPFTEEGSTVRLSAYELCSSGGTTPCNSKQANRFEVPTGGILTGVSLAPYYASEFSGSSLPSNTPRDFTLTIWADNGANAPSDNVLFSVDVEDDRRNGARGALTFKDVNLAAYQDQLDALPSPVYIGLTDAGTDRNFLIMGVTEFEGENVSFLNLPNFDGWAAFPNIVSGGEPILENHVLPIRASFLVPATPTANEDAADVPSRIALHPNFPNPFNPTTSISYALPQAAQVRLSVYDVLGRQVAVLVDGLQPSGTHQVQVNAEQWASGMYFYTLETATQKLTRRMVLIK